MGLVVQEGLGALVDKVDPVVLEVPVALVGPTVQHVRSVNQEDLVDLEVLVE